MNEFDKLWLAGAAFTFGLLESERKKPELPFPGRVLDLFLTTAMCLFAWPYILGMAAGRHLRKP